MPAEIDALRQHLQTQIIGQPDLVDNLIITMLTGGHLLVEGTPGLAKTRAVRSLADAVEGSFQRIQFTPDLMPGDIVGTEIYRTQDASFEFLPGPVFNNFVLADEINRAPAKVQAALLEAMQERQVSIGQRTLGLPDPFLVMATQNPLDQEGTYPLPDAQLDRFMMQLRVGFPDATAEAKILKLARSEFDQDQADSNSQRPALMTAQRVRDARNSAMNVFMSDAVEQYLVQLVIATRNPADFNPGLADAIERGASPRASIALDRTSRAHAWLNERDYVTPDDVQAMAHNCLRHRLLLSLDAQAEQAPVDAVIDQLLQCVAVG